MIEREPSHSVSSCLPWCRGDLDQRHAARSNAAPVHELSTLFGVDRATVARWQAFWRDYIPQTPFWKLARGRLVPVVEIVVLPLSLLEAFHRTKDPCQDWGYLLRFLSTLLQ